MSAAISLPPFLLAAWRQFSLLKQLGAASGGVLVDVLRDFTLATSFGWSPTEFQRFTKIHEAAGNLDNTQSNTLTQFLQQYHKLQASVCLEKFILALKDSDCSESTVKNYRSDIAQFLEFVQPNSISETLTKSKIDDFVRYQREKGLQVSSIRRKLSSLAQFGGWLQKQSWFVQTEAAGTDAQTVTDALNSPKNNEDNSQSKHQEKPGLGTVTQDLQAQIEELSEKLESRTRRMLLPWLSLLMLLLFFGGLAVFGYRQLVSQVIKPLAYPSSPTRPNRVLSFQGRLTDTAQNPITTATNAQFRLYDSGPSTVGGTLLWDSGTCSVDPDQDGIFSTGLGDDCGAEIDPNVFTENANVWLQVGVGGETLSPRQPIRTVAYALNSETLQGYPISATGAATVNTVLVMDSAGDLVLGEVSPEIRSEAGTFTLSGQTLLLQTNSGSNGNIILDADGTGGVQIRDYLSAPGATLSATYAGGVPLTVAGGPSGTANLTTWTNNGGSTLAYIDSSGNVVINQTLGIGTDTDLLSLSSNALTVNGTLTATGTINSSGGTLQTNGTDRITNAGNLENIGTTELNGITYTWPGADGSSGHVLTTNGSGTLSWAAAAGLGTNYWRLSNGAFSPVNDTADLLVGGASTASAKFRFLNVNTGTPVASVSANSGNIATYITGDGTLATTNRNALTIGNSSAYDTTGNVLINPNGTGRVGIGTLTPNSQLTVAGTSAPTIDIHNTNTGLLSSNTALGNLDFVYQEAIDGKITRARVQAETGNNHRQFDLNFYTSSDGTLTNQLTVGSDGVVSVLTNNLSLPNSRSLVLGNGGNLGKGIVTPSGGMLSGQLLQLSLNTSNVNGFQLLTSAGTPLFEVANNGNARLAGNLGLGTTAPGAKLDVVGDIFAPNATFSANYAGGTALTLKGGPSGTANILNIQNNSSSNLAFFDSAGNLTLNTQNDLRLADADSSNYIALQSPAVVGSNITYTLPGSVTNGYVLQTDGSGTLTWADPAVLAGASTFWNQVDGALFAKNSTVDLLVGGQSTASAKFAVLNVNTGTPVASISANSGNIATYITGDGTLATTNRNALTIGNSSTYNTTGNVLINPNGTGNVGIGTTSPGAKLEVTGGNIALGNNQYLQWRDIATGTLQNIIRYSNSDALTITSPSTATVGSGALSLLGNNNTTLQATNGRINITTATNNASYFIALSTANTERMRIDNDGNVGINDTTPDAKLNILATTEQLRLDYDDSNYASFFTQADGELQLTTTGTDPDINLNPGTGGSLIFADLNCSGNANGGVLTADASGVVSCTDDDSGGAGGSSNWRISNGAISPINDTLDVLFGASATSSAKFRFLNVNTGTPVASVSANSGNIATYITGDGTLATTNRQTLTIGNSSTYNTTGNVLINPNGTGYVGIGTTTPQSILDINGRLTFEGDTGTQLYRVSDDNIRASGSFSALTQVLSPLFKNLTGSVTIAHEAGGNVYLGSTSTGTTQATNLILLPSSNVGIGTTTPGAKLDLNGDLFAPTATLSANYAGGTALTLKGGPSGTANILNIQNNSSSNLAFFNSAGDLTLNTQNDLRLADSDSSNYIALQSPSVVGSNITYTLPGTVTDGYIMRTDGSGTLSWVDPTTTGLWRQANGAISPINNTFDLLVGSNATTSAKFAVLNVNTGTPVASISANSGNIATYITGDGTLATTNRQALTIGNSSTYNTSGNVLINPNGTGYVGIGTTAPTRTLSVSGTAEFLGTRNVYINTTTNYGVRLKGSVGGWTQSFGFQGTADTQLGGFGAYGGDDTLTRFYIGTFNTDEKVSILTNGNVGIGTTTPGAKLDVFGDIFAPTATFSANYAGGTALTAKGGPSGTANIFSVQNNSSSELAFFNSAGDLTLNTQNDLRLADSDSSNYIALQAPAVVGSNITYTLPGTVTDGYVLQTDGSGTLSWVNSAAFGTNYWRLVNGALSPLNDTNDLLIGGVSTASAKFAFINVNSGSPTASISGNLALTVPTGTNPAATMDILNGGSLNIRTSAGGNAGLLSRFFVGNNGNVGIGTDTPTSKLQIAGATSTISNSSGDITIDSASDQISLSGDSLSNLLDIDASGQIKPGSYVVNPTALGSGSIIYRSDNGYLHYYNGSEWLALYPGLWQVNLNAYSPVGAYGSVADLLIGGTSTTSAKIALDATTGYLYAQRFVDKANTQYYLDPAATGQSLSVVGKSGFGTATPEHQIHVNATVTGKALAVFNETGNNSILVASSAGTRVFEIQNEGNIIAGNPTKQDINVTVYGDLFSADDTNLETAATGIVSSYLYDTATDRDGGYWRKSAVSKTLSWYTESRDDSLGIPCSLTSNDRCGTEYFPAKANLVLSTDGLYIFDALSNTLWMKFSFGSGNALGASSVENSPTSVTAIDGRIFVGTRGSSGGIYELNFKTDTMSLYTTTDRSESNQLISARNGGSNTFASNSMTAFALTNRSVNDLDTTYANGKAQLAAATNAGINLIDLDYKLGYVFNEEASDSNPGETISDDGNTANPATNAFDGIESTVTRSDAADSVMTITYQFASGKVIQRYGMMMDDADLNEAPSAWTFEGSSNGSTWVTLDSRSGYDWFDIGTNGNTQLWEITNTTSYPYYRLVVSDVFNAAADSVRIAEIYLQTKAQKPATRLYGEDMAKNFTPNVTTAANTTTVSKRRVTDWRRVSLNGDYRAATTDTLPMLTVSLRKSTAITQYTVTASSTDTREPTAWSMQGSNDGITWTTLDTQTAQTFAAAYVPKTYTFSNSTAYKHYRLDITANNGATITEVGDFQVGTPVITASSSSNDTTADESNLLFQDNSAAAYHWLANAGANEWVQYDYGAANPKIITSYALRGYQAAQPTRAITGWNIQGSNDCSSWTTLDTQTGQSFATDYTLNDYTFSNTTAYRCYRLFVNTLNGGTLASLKGLYFFGAEDRLIASSDESDAADNVARLNDEGDWGRWSSLANDETGWIEKQFAEGQEATVSGVVLEGATSVAESIQDFTILGSNDRVSWTTLLTKDRNLISAATDVRSFKFANNTGYRFYQLDLEATNNSTTASLDELKLLGGHYTKVAFSDNAIVGTNSSTGQLDIYNNVFADTTDQALSFTGTLTTDTDAALSAMPSIHSSVTPQLLFPALSGSISQTPYALETDGGSIYVGHANGVDVIKNNPHADPDGNFAPAQISGRINTTRNVNNPFGFDHYWPMDEASSAAQLNNLGNSGWNSAGLELNGSAAAPVSTEAGKINRGYSFSNAQYIEAIQDASFADLDSNGEFTVGGWVFQDAAGLTGDQYIMGDYINNGATINGFALGVRDGALVMFAGNNGAGHSVAFQSSGASVPTEEWTHVVLKLENSTLKMYVNGELRDSSATAAFTDGNIFYIGWINANAVTTNRWQGRLDELFVKHAAVSDSDIKKIYERGLKNGQDPRAQVTSPDSVTVSDASVVSSTTIGSSTLNLAPNALAGKVVEITGGTGAGQTRLITKNSTTTLTVSPAWSVTPDNTSDFEVTPNALPGSVNTAKAIRADGQNIFVGLNDGSDGGGVVRMGHKSLAVSDYYHGNAGKTDSTSGAWNTTSGYDDIVGVESTTDNLLIMSRTSIWREKLGESLLEAITRLQQAFSAATLDTHTQDMHGTNTRNATTQVIRKGWGYLDGGDTSRTVYYGITYDELPIVLGNLAGVGSTVAQTAPTSLDQCTLGTVGVDAIGVSAIRKDKFSVAEANTNNACFTWMSMGSYSGSTPEGSFGSSYTGGADLAEWYGTDDTTLEAAEVVSIDPSGDIKVMRSGKPQDSTAIGIIATQPSIVMGDKTGLTPGYKTDPQLTRGAASAVQVALAGRVPVKVSLENGPIKAGDYLTTGSIPGTAAKAVKAGPTIGKALENFDGKSTIVGMLDSQVKLGSDLVTQLASNSAAIATDSAKVDGTVQVIDEDQKMLSSGQGVIMAFVNTSYFDPAYANTSTSTTQGDGAYAIDSAGNVIGLGAYSFDLVDNAKYLNELLAEAETIASESATATGSAQLSSERENILQAALARLKSLGSLSLKELNTAQLRVLGSLFSRKVETEKLSTDLVTPLTQADLNFQFGTASESGSLNIRNQNNDVVTSIDENGNVTALGSLIAPEASIAGEIVAGSVAAGDITAQSSRLDYLEGKVAELGHIRAQTAELVNATISGTLFADDIYEFDEKIAAALEQPSLLSKLLPQQTATPSTQLSTLLAGINTPTFNEASISGSLQKNVTDLSIGENDLVLSAEAAYINQYFQVNGDAYFGQSLEVANQAIVGNSLHIGSALTITENSITADVSKLPDQTLYFQPSGQGSLNFLAGVLTLNDQGEVSITGNLSIKGNLNVSNSLLTNLLQPSDFNQALQVKLATQSGVVAGATTETTRSRFEIVDELGTPVATISSQGKASFAGGLEIESADLTATGSGTVTTDQTSGKAQLSAGSTELTISAPSITTDSLIYITPTSSTGNQVLYVKKQIADDVTTPEIESQFIVGLDQAITENIQFNWWIIN